LCHWLVDNPAYSVIILILNLLILLEGDTMKYPEYMNAGDIADFEYDYNRMVDAEDIAQEQYDEYLLDQAFISKSVEFEDVPF